MSSLTSRQKARLLIVPLFSCVAVLESHWVHYSGQHWAHYIGGSCSQISRLQIIFLLLPVSQQHVPNRGKCVGKNLEWHSRANGLFKLVELLAFISNPVAVNLSPGQDQRGSFTSLICCGLCHGQPSFLPSPHPSSIPRENSPVLVGSSHSNFSLATTLSDLIRGLEKVNKLPWCNRIHFLELYFSIQSSFDHIRGSLEKILQCVHTKGGNCWAYPGRYMLFKRYLLVPHLSHRSMHHKTFYIP